MKRGVVALLALAAAGALALLPATAQTTYAYGSQVRAGDSDGGRTVRDAGTPSICHIDLGNGGDITDDAFYVVWDGGTDVEKHNLRLTTVGGNGPGSLVLDEDVIEHATLSADTCDTTPSFCYADLDSSGTFNGGDYAYATSGGTITDCLVAPNTGSSPDEWSVRLTPAGAHAAGTLVRNGQNDLISYGSGDSNLDIPGAEFTYWDHDASANQNPGDQFWMASQAVTTGSIIPLFSVRMTASSSAPPTTTSTTPTTGPTPPTSPTSTSTTPASSSSTTTPIGPPSFTTRLPGATRTSEDLSAAGADSEAGGSLGLWIALGAGGLAVVGGGVAGAVFLVRRRPKVPTWSGSPARPGGSPQPPPAEGSSWQPVTKASPCPQCGALLAVGPPGTPCPQCGYRGPPT